MANQKIDFFMPNLKSAKQQKTFENIYKKNNGNWSAVKSEITSNEGFTPEIINSLEFTHYLSEWSKDNKELIAVFQKDDQINSMSDIAAKFSKEEFIEKVKGFAPEESEEGKKAFALNLHRGLFSMEPTAMLVNMIRDPQVPMLNDEIGSNVAAVLAKHPDFNIKTTSVYEIIKNEEAFKDIPPENHETVIARLKILQRIAAVSEDTDAVPVLYNSKLHSAMQISAMPRKQFMAAMSRSGLDDSTLMQIHTNAQQARVRNEQAIIALREAYKGTGVAMIDNSMNMSVGAKGEKLAEHNLSWDMLFGDSDFCECDECSSVYSAAAYYVELLQYLRNNNINPESAGPIAIKTNPRDISGTPLEKLFDRRPDLGCLELTCKNTNTILPYIDLVNEVMENYVAFKHLKPFNVEDEVSSELLAEPQNTEYQAYCILKDEVYPFTLPYHQPIDAERIYLKHLDTSRYELIKTFKRNNPDTNEALDRAADAEFLGLTMEEYLILTKECFESKALIDAKPVCKYYGFDDDKTMLGDDGLTLIKKEFLRRTGIDYFNLVGLLRTGYINPGMPKGKSKTIMEGLHFSYRFLQNYARVYGINKMAEDLVKGEKLANQMPWLKELVELLTGKKTLGCPKSSRSTTEITDEDIIHWVKCSFEKVGKMMVIESGRGFVNGKILRSGREVGSIEDCKVYLNNDIKKIKRGTVDKKTGKISLNDMQIPINNSSLKDFSFISGRGEKGVFLAIDKNIHLIFLEQKDSCDLDTALLKHLDGTSLTVEEYDRTHRFIRLWRKLGWTIDETDQAIAGLSSEHECKNADCDDCEEGTVKQNLDINPELIHQLAAVKKLLDKTGLEVTKLLSFWSDINTFGEKSLYKRLFLTNNALRIDKIFKADDMGNYLAADAKLLEHVPVIMASLNLSADDIQAIMQAAGMKDKLTLSNLSILYRYRLLSRVLGLRIPDFVSLLPLYGDVFQNAHKTLEFIEHWEKAESAGFTHQQLNYIIRGADDEKKPLAPTQKNILQLSKALYDGLNAIDETHKDLKADSSITEPSLQKINIRDQATDTLIREKTSLIFETDSVEKIMGTLEGTNVFATNAPINLDFTLSDTSTLKNKFNYSKDQGTIQIKGILTESEVIDYEAVSSEPGWIEALARIQKQQDKLFKELFWGMFENEKTKTDDQKAKLEEIIRSGDIMIPLDEIPEEKEDANTAPRKRAAFLEVFLPYLRQQLSHHFVIDTLAGFTGLDTKITGVLVSKVLKLGSSAEPIYSIFEKIKESTKPGEINWSGYLIPAADANYTFIIKNSDIKPAVIIDGEVLNFTAQEDPTDEWWSGIKALQAGKLYKLAANGTELKNICWKTPASAGTPIPSSALIPDFAPAQCEPALIALKKATMLVSVFDLSADEIQFLDRHNINFDNLNFNALTLVQWLRIEAYIRLRNSLPQAKLNMLDFWNWIYKTASDETKTETETIIEKIVDLTTWNKEQIKKLIAANHFDIDKLEDYRDEKNLLKLQKALTVADKTGIDIDSLFEWAVPVSKFNTCCKIADGIKNAIRARYNQTDWEQVVKPLHDQLRNNQKEALIAYLLQQDEIINWNVNDADGLFEYFLIDVQMEPGMETSRIKQAVSSVQLFVQRCFLGLEDGIRPDTLDRSRWDWMQRYRVWEANRKVFLYPENWIESNLRDDKSTFFKELESELLQKDINKQNVADALKSYLYKVDEVADMEVVGLYIETKLDYEGKQINIPKKLHVFSRTRSAPYFFYYRFYDATERDWYPWEKMQVDIPSYDVSYIPFDKISIKNFSELIKMIPEGDDITFLNKIYSVNNSDKYYYLNTSDLSYVDSVRLNEILRKLNYDYKYKYNEINDNGCYLVPVVWNERLLIFFPQIIKKTKTEKLKKSDGQEETINSLAGRTVTDIKPSECYEIKMAWSEYRNGKWTQKQISKDAVFSDKKDFINDIQYFKFVPIADENKVSINVDDNLDTDEGYKGVFEFNGTALEVGKAMNTESIPINYFNKSDGKLYSWQIDSNSSGLKRQYKGIYFYESSSGEKIKGLGTVQTEFHHSDILNLLGRINRGQLEDFFKENLSMSEESFGPFDRNDNFHTPDIYHELKRPYSIYNWELFFHMPILLADALSKARHFEEAMKWFHFVFNPIADGNEDNRFWLFKPFRYINSKRVLDSIFNNLKPNKADENINEWRNKPFMPHVVARSRPVAYMKWVVMKYIDNLLAWGDCLFRQDTIESINQATQLYVLAGCILGPRPMMIPKRGKIKPQTYIGLLDKWDAFGNAMVELELAAPFGNQTASAFGMVNKDIAYANIFGSASSLYFSIPNNPKLMGYWDTLADRLYKIRHCQNIEGVLRKLPLFEPPIDPALLVKAAAQGLSIASLLNDLNTPMPNYRFYYLLQKALELCSELKSLGAAMLSAIEKKDNETIALIRAKHEGAMQNLMMEIKKKQLEEAQKNLESLMQNRKAPEARMKYYLKLSGEDESLVPSDTEDFNEISNNIETVDGDSGLRLIKFEKEDMERSGEANEKQKAITPIEKMVSICNAIPSLTVNVQPFGIGLGTSFGGANIGSIEQSKARVMQGDVADLSFQSTSAGKKGGFTRALQERIFQANAAGYELKQIDMQIIAQEIRIEIAGREIKNQQKAIDNANEVEEFIKNKYSSEELYTWMRESLKTLYHQVYNLAYELAKKAEKTYCFERGISNANFIQSGYFDAGRDGLLAGEQLYVGLKQLEAAYQNERGYEYEITKQLSLYQINPLAVIQLRKTGKCEFALPEVLFDMDYPGHFKRRIKSVSVSIPCIAGPYTGINATLSLLGNKFRNTAVGGKTYEEDTDKTDERFSSYAIPINAIAASSAQNDSGMFELNFKDERYLPFEGAGVISKWRLELPTFRQFDYHSISDVIIHLKYTACEGGERLKAAATKSLSKQLESIEQKLNETGLHVALNMKYDLTNEWLLLTKNGTVELRIDKSRLPYIAQTLNAAIENVMFLAKVKDNQGAYSIKIDDNSANLKRIDEWKLYKGSSSDIGLGKTFTLSAERNLLDNLEGLVMVVKYSF